MKKSRLFMLFITIAAAVALIACSGNATSQQQTKPEQKSAPKPAEQAAAANNTGAAAPAAPAAGNPPADKPAEPAPPKKDMDKNVPPPPPPPPADPDKPVPPSLPMSNWQYGIAKEFDPAGMKVKMEVKGDSKDYALTSEAVTMAHQSAGNSPQDIIGKEFRFLAADVNGTETISIMKLKEFDAGVPPPQQQGQQPAPGMKLPPSNPNIGNTGDQVLNGVLRDVNPEAKTIEIEVDGDLIQLTYAGHTSFFVDGKDTPPEGMLIDTQAYVGTRDENGKKIVQFCKQSAQAGSK